MKIKVINKSKHQLPDYSAKALAGPESGLAIKKGITILKSPGTIDADYLGEVSIIRASLSNENFVIKDGERICQMVISKHETAEWENVEGLLDSEREAGGFGHTGKK
jgi:dUTP pyrophosphatase